MTHDEMIAVIQAHKEGKQIQISSKNKNEFCEDFAPNFDFCGYDYRIKPEPFKIETNAQIRAGEEFDYIQFQGYTCKLSIKDTNQKRITYAGAKVKIIIEEIVE